jgi:hypothetical protein
MLLLLLLLVVEAQQSFVTSPWQHFLHHFINESGLCGDVVGGLNGQVRKKKRTESEWFTIVGQANGLRDSGYYSCAPAIPSSVPMSNWLECGPADMAFASSNSRRKCADPTTISMLEGSLLPGCQDGNPGLGPVVFNFFQT